MRTNEERARLRLKQMHDGLDPLVSDRALNHLAEKLTQETGEAWDADRVEKEFLLPVIEKALDSAIDNIAPWKRLSDSSGRDMYGRKRRGSSLF